jgi:DNA polymerase I-like protein with 3'-5' exonuclease and polymerase domains
LRTSENGVDIYSKFASDVYERPIDKSIDKVERFVGKTCILGLGYGMGKDKFKSTLKLAWLVYRLTCRSKMLSVLLSCTDKNMNA